MRLKDLTGQKFGRLTVIERAEKTDSNRNAYWLCKCECGKICVVKGVYLLNGDTKSCGCIHREQLVARLTTHGLTHDPLHKKWKSIKNRCFNSKCKRYKDYGGRGITMYEPWIHDFKAFYDYV